MTHTYVKLKILSLDLSRHRAVELLVDTRSTYSWIDAKALEELGVQLRRVWRFKTIEGRIIERRIGDAFVEYDGERAPTVVVFAEEKDGKVLGVHALEGLRLEVDPSTGSLRRSEASLAFASVI